ncbi:MAG TPA: SPOR domain-containing protein, partial [Thermodesulfovibrionales bacterium]|nr:SPOR domain-containing protein [Thermodesulfovibrionales bacterium]
VYSVQIGVFKNKKNASTLTKRYEKKGYEAFMHKSSTGEKKFVYRVLIGKFAGRDEAAGWAKKISAEERTKATVFKR